MQEEQDRDLAVSIQQQQDAERQKNVEDSVQILKKIPRLIKSVPNQGSSLEKNTHTVGTSTDDLIGSENAPQKPGTSNRDKKETDVSKDDSNTKGTNTEDLNEFSKRPITSCKD